jgi:hypothetical protein
VLFAFLILILIPLCSSAGFSPGIWTNPSPDEYVTYDECTVWTVEEVLTYETTSTASVIRTESSYMPSVKSLNHIDFRFATATVYEVNNEYVSKFSFGTYVDYAAGASCANDAYIHYDLSNGLYLYTDAFLDKCHTNYPKHFDQTWTNRRDMIVGTNEYGITNTIRRQATVSRSFHESITVSQVEACAIESVAAVWERKELPQDYRLPPFLVNPRPDYWVSEEWSEGISVDWIAALKYVKDWIKSSVVEKPYRVRYRHGITGRFFDLPYSFYLSPPGITEVAIPWDLGGYEIRYKGYGTTSEKLGWLNTNKLTLAHHDAGVMSLHSGTGILTRAFSAPLLTLADLYEVVPEMPLATTNVVDTWTNVFYWYQGQDHPPASPADYYPLKSWTWTNAAYYASYLDWTPSNQSSQRHVTTNEYLLSFELPSNLPTSSIPYSVTNSLDAVPPEAYVRIQTNTVDGFEWRYTEAVVVDTNPAYSVVFSASPSVWTMEVYRATNQIYGAASPATNHMALVEVSEGTNEWTMLDPWQVNLSVAFTNAHIAPGFTAQDYLSWEHIPKLMSMFAARGGAENGWYPPTVHGDSYLAHRRKRPGQSGDPPCYYDEYGWMDDFNWTHLRAYKATGWGCVFTRYIEDARLIVNYGGSANTYMSKAPMAVQLVARLHLYPTSTKFWFGGNVDENELFYLIDNEYEANWVGKTYDVDMADFIGEPPFWTGCAEDECNHGWDFGETPHVIRRMNYYWK